MRKLSKALMVAVLATSPSAFAQGEAPAPYAPPIPPGAEGQAFAGAGGGYCYGGSHPVDTRVERGQPWHETNAPHTHFYPPFDLRLFAYHEGCYHFVSDPTDFGYTGQTWNYYGAHPVLESYGGGWCFMVGSHHHFWQPWSSHFVVVGPWYYWQGTYDAFFWSYWPYYSFYYQDHYPRYYGGGRFSRGRGREVHVAPPIKSVPTPVAPSGVMAGGVRGSGPRGTDGTAVSPAGGAVTNRTWRPGAAADPGWRAAPGATSGVRGGIGGSMPPSSTIPYDPGSRTSRGSFIPRGSESIGGSTGGGWGGGFSGSPGRASPAPSPSPAPSRPAPSAGSSIRGGIGGGGSGMVSPRAGGASGWRK